MARIEIDKERCKGCELCCISCSEKLIVMDDFLNIRGVRPAKSLDSGKCLGCKMCAIMCPDVCIKVYK